MSRSYLLDDETLGVDPLDSTRLTYGQRNRRFVPIEETPDNSLDPFEALVAKEEIALGLHGKNGHQVKVNGHAGPTRLAQPEPANWEKYYDQCLEISARPFTDLDEHPDIESVAEDIERILACKRQYRREFWFDSCQSHGNRGRKPAYKDKISNVVRY